MNSEDPKTLSKVEHAYVQISDWIVFQELPPGSVLSETQLMKMTELGRTPIREALQRLALEHMIEIHPYRGTFVRQISAEDQLKALEVREPLELLAAKLAAQRRNNYDLTKFVKLIDRLEKFESPNIRDFGTLLSEAHHLLIEASENEYLSSMLSAIHGPSRRFWFANLNDPKKDLRDGALHHSRILNHIQNGDVEGAQNEVRKLHKYLLDFTFNAIRR